MSEIIQISCPGCNAIFELPVELGGELGECTECGAIFEIPRVEAVHSGMVNTTDTGAIKVDRTEAEEGTNTVKLSRSSIGMVPDIKDNFTFDVNASAGAQQGAAPSNAFASPQNGKKTFTKKTRVGMTRRGRTTPVPKKKWWQFWK